MENHEELIRGVFDTSRESLVILDASLKVVMANASFYTTFQITPEETLGKFIYDLGDRQWDIPELRKLLEGILPQNTSFENFEVSHTFPEMGEKTMVLNARRLKGKSGKTHMILLAIEDITERRILENRVHHLSEVLRAIRDINQLIVREQNKDALLQRATEILVEVNGYRSVCIHHNDTIYMSGEKTMCERVSAMVKETGDPIAPSPVNGLFFISLPMRKGEAHAILSVVHAKEFTEDEMDLLEEITGDIAFALHAIALEQKRQESEERYRAIVEYSHDGILVVGDDYRFAYVNDRLCDMLGYPQNEIIGRDFREFLDEESRELVADRYVRRQRGEDVPSRYEFNIVRKDGEKRRVEISSTVIRDSEGAVYTIAQLLDITARKKAEEERIRALNEWKATFDATEESIMLLDTDFTILRANRASSSFFNLSTEQLTGKNCYSLVHGTTAPVATCPLEKMKHSNHHEEEEMYLEAKKAWVLISVDPIFNGGATFTKAVHIMRNITERKMAEEKLQHAYREVERALKEEQKFKMATAHYFFNPIAIAKGYLDLALEEGDGEDKIKKAIAAINRVEKVVKNVTQRGEIRE